MSAPLVVRMTAPVVGVSILLLGVGVVAAWYVQQMQRNASDVLASNVGSMRAAEELEIGLREIRTQMNQYLLTSDRAALDAVPALRTETDRWLREAERFGTTDREQKLMASVKRGYDRFFEEFDMFSQGGPGTRPHDEVAELVSEVLSKEIVSPAHEYLDFNEQVIARSSEQSQAIANRMVLALLLLGICGPVAGLLAGFGIARGVSRSIVQLSVPVHDAAGKLNEVVGPFTLSGGWEIEELEARLRRVAEQVSMVVERLQQSQREVLRAEQLAAVGQLAAGVAHELRNPLTSMKLLVQTAEERGDAGALVGRDLKVLKEAIGRVERSVQTFLDFARPPALEKRRFELRGVVEQTVELVSGQAGRQRVRIQCEGSVEPIFVEADLGQIRQVLLNLLLNALDAVPEGGNVSVMIEQSNGGLREPGDSKAGTAGADWGRWLTIHVADTGCGLPAELGDRIFEPFVTSKETGIGLGLPICKRIIEAHGGQIVAASRPQGGAAFTVRLPIAPASDSHPCTSEDLSSVDD